MATNMNSRTKGQSKTRSAGQSAPRAKKSAGQNSRSQGNSEPSALSTIMDSLAATSSMGPEIKGTIENFARAIDSMTMGDASATVAQVQETIEHATATAAHAKETYDLAKVAFDSVRGTAKQVFAQVKQNPEPLIAAAVPAVMGLYMLYRRSQSMKMGGMQQQQQPTRQRSATRMIAAP